MVVVGRLVGTFEPAWVMVAIAQAASASAMANTAPPTQPAGTAAGMNRKGMSHRTAFLLILQQTLLIGAAALSGLAVAQTAGGAFANVLGRGIAHLTLYLAPLALYLIGLPGVYGFSALGNPLQLFALASVFILATSFMGQALGVWFKRPETPALIFLGTSLPQFFLTGFAWPREAIPTPAQTVGYIFHSDLAIDGIVRIDQLGASLWGGCR
jgi:ABC-2 type transport system permease protein